MRSYAPSIQQQKQLEELGRVIEAAKKENILISIFGGYGLDGLYGKLTRAHHDIDILVKSEQREDLIKRILDLGYYEYPEKWGKIKYKKKGLGNTFHIEVVLPERLMLFVSIGENELFPQNENSKLNEFIFRSPTLKGHEHIHKVQTKIAAERGWGEYEQEVRRKELVDLIQKRL